ncbi:MAG: 4-(cytidine 5'-diphospho)-2-C-methyl-D-erythritol kinase [Candidatus Marinimicrobia bacterium]|nr:4-(cytidine 5'-diphospho)-2-C-methyl-D-erythritol kinase [Candidatus Neomarinimicrobiota bacterium]MCF7829051.1 4-(cytidine 5'-diphospho)-2-C-methyl-D-erythritol kinase [Candidatus Neomarinimicrobiota bacterium]MCF7881812.1 4-(cytidine 5'-diphospho)-2-C-methyl-D-erythritol kinase [Candidatus Neomarinimicrobiota bacterium]
MDALRLRSNAKINLGLRITGRRDDGYHLIETIFQEVDFGDSLFFEKTESPGFEIITEHQGLPTDQSNLCYKAFELLRDRFPGIDNVRLTVDKRIPMGSGLGGGSSNAATTLIGLAKLFDLDIAPTDLTSLAVQVGADVPFFLYGGAARASGIGEEIEPLTTSLGSPVVIVVPDIHISTGWAYANVKYDLTSSDIENKFKGFFDNREFDRWLVNDFEPLVTERYSEIGDIRQRLMHLRADHVSLSGSGSAIFGIYSDSAAAQQAVEALKKDYFSVLANPVARTQPRMQAVLSSSAPISPL